MKTYKTLVWEITRASRSYEVFCKKINKIWLNSAELAYYRLKGGADINSGVLMKPHPRSAKMLIAIRKEFPEVTKEELIRDAKEEWG